MGVVAALMVATPAHALLVAGSTALNFSKNRLSGTSVGPLLSTADLAGKIKVMFMLGYG